MRGVPTSRGEVGFAGGLAVWSLARSDGDGKVTECQDGVVLATASGTGPGDGGLSGARIAG